MRRLLKFWTLWLILVPVFASAETVTINANATGIFSGYSFPLDQFVYYELPFGDHAVPVTINMSATFDPDDPDYSETDSNGVRTSTQLTAPATFTLLAGGRTFEFAGNTTIQSLSSAGWYTFVVGMQNMNFDFRFSLTFMDPMLSSGHPLAPGSLGTQDGMTASYLFESWPSNPDAPGYWRDSGNMDSASVSVLSAVPEPGQAGMLLVGACILAGAMRRRRCSTPRLAPPFGLHS